MENQNEHGNQSNGTNSDWLNQDQKSSVKPQNEGMSVGSWVLTLIITCIPIVGFVLLIVWACTAEDTAHKGRKNWAVAELIIMIISVVICLIVGISTGFALLNNI